jgi:hypothetical protein
MIEDELGLVSPEFFKKLFFTYFKGEKYAYQVFEMLLPTITEHFDEESNQFIEENDPKATE